METKFRIKTISESYALDIHTGGERSSHFVSITAEISEDISLDDLPRFQMEAAYKVSVATIYNAMARGALSVDQANNRIQTLKENFENLKNVLDSRAR